LTTSFYRFGGQTPTIFCWFSAKINRLMCWISQLPHLIINNKWKKLSMMPDSVCEGQLKTEVYLSGATLITGIES
jgi:hypothetical protein